MKILRNRRFATLAVGAAAVLALAACGSSSKATVSPGAQPANTSSPTTAAGSATPVVKTGTTAKLGAVLVDGKGMTLYTLTNSGAPVACTGQCAMVWPPLLVPAGTVTVPAVAGVSGLGTAAGAGGTQVTSAHLPLYRYSGDSAAGDTNGDGISAFGGVWHVVKAPATAAVAPVPETTPTTATPTTTSSSGYGY